MKISIEKQRHVLFDYVYTGLNQQQNSSHYVTSYKTSCTP